MTFVRATDLLEPHTFLFACLLLSAHRSHSGVTHRPHHPGHRLPVTASTGQRVSDWQLLTHTTTACLLLFLRRRANTRACQHSEVSNHPDLQLSSAFRGFCNYVFLSGATRPTRELDADQHPFSAPGGQFHTSLLQGKSRQLDLQPHTPHLQR